MGDLPASFEVDVVDAAGVMDPPDLEWLQSHAQQAGARLGCVGTMVLRVVGDLEMSCAHSRHSGVNGTTDVLTFDWLSRMSPPNPEYIYTNIKQTYQHISPFHVVIDVLACADEAQRQASIRGYHFRRELLLYAVHGILHGLGLDDQTEEQASVMHGLEDAVLRAIGVGEVFGVDERRLDS
jgi:probable rRNA maturation factor